MAKISDIEYDKFSKQLAQRFELKDKQIKKHKK